MNTPAMVEGNVYKIDNIKFSFSQEKKTNILKSDTKTTNMFS